MPIPFACPCGKRLLAKEEYAGRRMKCPACGTVLTIPEPTAETLVFPPNGSLPAPASASTLHAPTQAKPEPSFFNYSMDEQPSPSVSKLPPTRSSARHSVDSLVAQASAPWRDMECRKKRGITRFHHAERADSRRGLWLALGLIALAGLTAMWLFKDKLPV